MSDWQLIHGDCLAVLPTLADASVDAIVTDPPYCSGGVTETSRRSAAGQGLRSGTIQRFGWFVGDNMGTPGLVWLLRSLAFESSRVLKQGASMCVFCDWRMVASLAPAIESAGLRFQNLVVWDKGSMGLGVGFRMQHEIVLHFVKGTGVFCSKNTGNVIKSGRVHASEREHQTQKPVDLLQQICRVVAPVGGLVLDPFAGSGSTGLAAIAEGMRFVGVERDAEYVAVATKRLTAADAAAEEASRQMALPGTGGKL